MSADHIIVSVRVQPGASRSRVGGAYGEGDAVMLRVAVGQPAVDGKANKAVIEALAKSFGVKRRDVMVVSGHTSRSKRIQLDGDPARLKAVLRELLASS